MARPPVTRVPLGNFTDTGPRDIDPPHFKKSCLPHHPLHSGAKCSPCTTWLTLAPSLSQEPAKQWLCQPDGALDRQIGVAAFFFLFRHSPAGPAEQPDRCLLSLIRWPKDGALERVSQLGFAGLCDNLQQRAMSRRCLPLQQPLRRVSKDPFIHLWGARGCLASERALLEKRTAQVFLQRTARKRRALSRTRGVFMLTALIVWGCVHV